MENTSLQNIISSEPKHLEQSEIRRLFQKHHYPRFELKDLRGKPELMKLQPYVFFVNLLQKWNKKVGNSAKEVNQCEYRKIEFIFCWLKWTGVQSSKHIDSSLGRLQTWYNSSRHKQPIISIHKQNMTKSLAQEWQIRNSYKSNLPSQIENYRRRALFQFNTTTSSPKHGQEKENVGIVQLLRVKMLKQAQQHAYYNSCLRQVREKQEMDGYLRIFKKSKVQFYQKLTKNYTKKEFSKDKLELSGSKPKNILSKSQIIRPYMIKTLTESSKKLTRLQHSILNQTQTSFCQTEINSSKQNSNEDEINTRINESKSFNTSKIDGLGLLSNPFDLRIKKKKRS